MNRIVERATKSNIPFEVLSAVRGVYAEYVRGNMNAMEASSAYHELVRDFRGCMRSDFQDKMVWDACEIIREELINTLTF